MVYNFTIEKSNARTHETVSTNGINTSKWGEVCEFWVLNGIDKYEDIENSLKYLNTERGYDLFCNTDAMFGDGLVVNIKGTAKNN